MNKSRKPRKPGSKRTPQRSVPETPPEPQVSTGLPSEESPGRQPQALTGMEVTELGNNAQFVSQTGIPANMRPGQRATVSVTMKNTGTTTWTPAGEYKLGSQNPQDNTLWTGQTRVYLSASEAIAPGQQKTFTFEITAPTTPVTRDFQWRMVQDGVEWFGDFTPNLKIAVAAPTQANDAQYVSQSVPAQLQPGQRATVSVTMKNTGTTTWTAGGEYKLGSQNPQDNTLWTGSPRVYLSASDSIAPGQQKTFTFDITAPSSPVTRDFQWRMVQDGVEWFGSFTSNVKIAVAAVPSQVNGAQFISQSGIPSTMQPGQKATVAITMKNTGTTTWTAGGEYKLGSQNPQDNVFWTGSPRVYLSASEAIASGQQKTFTFEITAPNLPGIHDFQWRMVQDGVEWFGNFTPNVPITVVAPTQANDARYVSQSVPEALRPGQRATVSITLENTGTTTWTAGGEYKLGSQNPQDNVFWTGSPRVYLSASEAIAPGQQKTFTFEITAPTTPVTRDFQWRMVQDGVEWFGDFTSDVNIAGEEGEGPPLESNGARYVSQMGIPANMLQGERTTVSVTMENTGSTSWDPAANYFLGSQNPENNWTWGLNRVPLRGLVAPGEQEAFTFTITAPSQSGDANFQWRMLRENVEWFGESTQNVAIKVTHESEQPDNIRFGVVGHPSLGFEPRNVELLQTLGVGWVRAAFDWDEMEPQKGNIQWETAERLVTALTDRKLKIYWDFSYAPSWANGGRSHNYPPLDQQDLYNFVKAVVTRFKNDVDCWATWNEPNLSSFYQGSRTRYVEKEFETTLRAIKDAHPEAKIAVGELFNRESFWWAWGYQGWLFDMLSKAKGRFDVISHHVYGDSANCGDPAKDVANLASKLRERGFGDYPIWITETGLNKTQSEQSNYLVCFYDSMKRVSQWEKTFWYRFGHETVSQHGLLNGNGQPTQTYYTYQRYILGNQGQVNGAQDATQSDILTSMRSSE